MSKVVEAVEAGLSSNERPFKRSRTEGDDRPRSPTYPPKPPRQDSVLACFGDSDTSDTERSADLRRRITAAQRLHRKLKSQQSESPPQSRRGILLAAELDSEYERLTGMFVAVQDPDGNYLHSFQVPRALVKAIENSAGVDTRREAIMSVEDGSDVAALVRYLVNLPSINEEADDCDEDEEDCDEDEDDEWCGLGKIKNKHLRMLAEVCEKVKGIPRGSDMVILELLNQ